MENQVIINDDFVNKKTAANERFGVMAAVARRKCSGNLQLPAPQRVQWKPPLRQAATTLCASGRQCVGQRAKNQEDISENLTNKKNRNTLKTNK